MQDAQRYIRQTVLPGFGQEGQGRLAAAAVLVVGAGGLGCAALQQLCASGVGHIGIVEDDRVSLHNLHRQLLYEAADIGRRKGEAAAEKLRRMNPDVHIRLYDERLQRGNALEIIDRYDLVLDATDNFAARYLINDACVLLGKAFVYGAAQGYEGQYAVFNAGDGPTYRCLFPARPPAALIPDCNGGGVLGPAPGIIGAFQALDAIKLITGIGTLASGVLQLHDFRYNTVRSIRLKTVPENKYRSALEADYGDLPGNPEDPHITPGSLHTLLSGGERPLLLDIRNDWEKSAGSFEGALCLDAGELESALSSLMAASHIVVVCEQGLRSRAAAAWIRQRMVHGSVQSLAGGMQEWQLHYPNQFLRC